jgi:hypothetical protein
MTKQQTINSLLDPFLNLKDPNWGNIYNAINQFILITNELEKQGNIIFKEDVGQLEKVEHKE